MPNTDPHAQPRAFRFILLCHQRSGSNALQAMLNETGEAAIWGQLFNQFWRYRRKQAKKGTPPPPRHPRAILHFGLRPGIAKRAECAILDRMPCAADVDTVARAYWRVHCSNDPTPYRAKGYKLHDFQVSDDDLARLGTEHADGVVILSRSNLLRAAVSWGYAKRTDVWSTRGRKVASKEVHALDPEDLRWFIDKTAREVDNWRQVLERAGANVLDLNFEREIETRGLERLWHFLGMPWKGTPDFATKRLAEPTYSHIANAREIDTALGSAATGRLFA